MSQEPPSAKKQKTMIDETKPAGAAIINETAEVVLEQEAAGRRQENSWPTKELTSLPFVHEYQYGNRYYRRECYSEYYQKEKAMLDAGKKCVTVTGTPGNGKPVFYAYFFQRFQKKEKDTWIIAMSYRLKRVVQAIVFKDDKEGESLNDTNFKKRYILY